MGEGKGNYKIFFKKGTTKIGSGLTTEEAKEWARQENEKEDVARLAQITDIEGGIPVDF